MEISPFYPNHLVLLAASFRGRHSDSSGSSSLYPQHSLLSTNPGRTFKLPTEPGNWNPTASHCEERNRGCSIFWTDLSHTLKLAFLCYTKAIFSSRWALHIFFTGVWSHRSMRFCLLWLAAGCWQLQGYCLHSGTILTWSSFITNQENKTTTQRLKWLEVRTRVCVCVCVWSREKTIWFGYMSV